MVELYKQVQTFCHIQDTYLTQKQIHILKVKWWKNQSPCHRIQKKNQGSYSICRQCELRAMTDQKSQKRSPHSFKWKTPRKRANHHKYLSTKHWLNEPHKTNTAKDEKTNKH